MDLEILSRFFFWASVINLGAGLLAFLAVVLGKRMVYRIHSRLYGVSEEVVANTIHRSMVSYKTITFAFFVIPYIAIQIIR